jgi:integrase
MRGRGEKTRKTVEAWIRANGNGNTRRAYGQYATEYLSFCAKKRCKPKHGATLARYMQWGLKRDRSESTINNTMVTAVFDIFRFRKTNPAHDPLVAEMKKIVKRLSKVATKKEFLPIEMLVRIVEDTDYTCLRDVRDALMLTLMTLGCIRQSNIVNLEVEDVWIEETDTNSLTILIYLEQSKTDQGRRGHTVLVSASLKSKLRVLHQLVTYEAMVRQACPGRTHFFQNVVRPFRPLAATAPNKILKGRLTRIGVDHRPYGSQSCRAGGATAAIRANISVRVLKRHGNWASDAVYVYIRDSREEQVSVSEAILGQAQ